MKHTFLKRSFTIAALLFAVNTVGFPQGSKTAPASVIDEKNVRAEMQFLAGDAMQGRGSGTMFERIAAEYIGSQFWQFGLEPAGEAGPDGKPTFVQTVNISRNSFEGNPTLKFGTTLLEHGKEMLVLRANGDKISGELQKITFGETPRAGSAAFIKLREGDDPQKLMQGLQGLLSSGAAIVIVEETPQWRSNWATMAARKLSFTVTSAQTKPTALIVVSKDMATTLSAAVEGTKIEFSGTLAPVQAQQTWNAIGKITGSDPALSPEIILLSSHLDHLGVRPTNPGDDKIFNGADDDASGSIAVLELARVLGKGERPKRTVYFVCFGSEEAGGYGANYFVNNLPFPKDKFVANLEFDII